MDKFNRKNVITLVFILVLLLAIPFGLRLLQEQQILKSKAAGGPITFQGINVSTQNGRQVFRLDDQGSPTVGLTLTSPFGESANSIPKSSLPPASSSFKRVFVTSQRHDGNLNGLVGADSICQLIADNYNYGGTWRSFLGDRQISAKDRIGNFGYKLLNNVIVANNKNDLLDETILNKININENGAILANSTDVWTGAQANGDLLGNTCNSWTSFSTSESGRAGNSDYSDKSWSDRSNPTCDRALSLYCFEQ